MTEFKLDFEELCRAANDIGEPWHRRTVAEVVRSIGGQLRDHGAPDAPFEQQAQALLAAFTAMQQTGEEMPSVDALCILATGGDGSGQTPEQRRAMRDQMALAQRLFRPIVARRTQERNDARADNTALRVRLQELEVAAREMVAALDAWGRAPDSPDYQREDKRSDEAWAALRVALQRTPRTIVPQIDALQAERDALRQRAERAERERDDARVEWERSQELAAEQTSMMLRHMDRRLEAEKEAQALRARIAELEAILAKACDYEATAAEVRASREPGADVVEKVAGIIFNGRARCEGSDGIARAVLAHLAAMGEAVRGAFPTDAETVASCEGLSLDVATVLTTKQALESRVVRIVAPGIGALRARVAELEAEQSKVGLILGNGGAKLQNRVDDALAIMSGREPRCVVCRSRNACKLDCPRRKWAT